MKNDTRNGVLAGILNTFDCKNSIRERKNRENGRTKKLPFAAFAKNCARTKERIYERQATATESREPTSLVILALFQNLTEDRKNKGSRTDAETSSA